MSAAGSTAGVRLDAIEHLKGVAIILVVAAHLVKYRTLGATDWYELFKYKVYLFHMPLFMFASGYVYFHRGAQLQRLSQLPGYAARRADRLLVPFFGLGMLIVAGKLLLSGFAYVDEAPATLAHALRGLVMDTENSPVLTIWYLFVLFVFCVATPVLYRLAGGRLALLALFAAFLYTLPVPDILFANRLAEFYLFFVAGGIAQSRRWLERLPGPWLALLLGGGFALLLALPFDRTAGLVVCGLAAALAIPSALRHAPDRLLDVLHFCGRHSMPVYLFNVIAIGAAKAFFLKTFTYEPGLFLPLLGVTFCAGIGAPLLLAWLTGLSSRTALIHRYIS